MNHDELRSTIQHYNWVEATDLIKALDTVVELHKPEKTIIGKSTDGSYEEAIYVCRKCSEWYPCLTIQVIEKELK
jgi:hypothetical protein